MGKIAPKMAELRKKAFKKPRSEVIIGIDGAGKTTFARNAADSSSEKVGTIELTNYDRKNKVFHRGKRSTR